MNTRQLEAFVYVADTGSFSAAAKELFLSQPTVSSQIAGLEKELDAKLLARDTRKVQLTEKGKVLYGYARKMLEIEKNIEKEFAICDEKADNSIRIAASTIPAEYVCPALLAAFSKKYPHYTYSLQEGDSADVHELVSAGKADIGFAGTRSKRGQHCKSIPFYRDELVIITPAEERFRKIDPAHFDLSLLNTEPVLIREEGSGTRRETEKFLTSQGIVPAELKVVAVISSQAAIKKAVSEGMGITVISAAAAKDYVERGKVLCFSFPDKPLYRDLSLVIPTDFRLNDAAHALIKFVQNGNYDGSRKEIG